MRGGTSLLAVGTHDDRTRVVLVAGAGRSGTSAMGLLARSVGLRVPPPEVPADDTNPRGFAESQWTVDLHESLLHRGGMALADARPDAATRADSSVREEDVAAVTAWLARHAASGQDLLVKDPRAAWFLPLWRSAATRAGLEPVGLTVLRHPAEVVGSNLRAYRHPGGAASQVGAWINLSLRTERASRDLPRALVRYAELLTDPLAEVRRAGVELRVPALASADPARVDGVVEPGLHRVSVGWSELAVTDGLARLAERVWEGLGGPSGTAPSPSALDTLAEEYARVYREAEDLSTSSRVADRLARRPGSPWARLRPRLPGLRRPRGPSDGVAPDGRRSAGPD
jgi:hypothetical protein